VRRQSAVAGASGKSKMSAEVMSPVAKVTKHKSAESDRFQCYDVYQLWEDGKVTIDHSIEDEEWGGIEESREITEKGKLPQGFFKAGFDRTINHVGKVREEPL
jgi:hypothetical protein